MTPRVERAFLFGVLIAMGAAWGFSQPMAKLAVSTGYKHFGIIFWQFVIGALCLGAINILRGKRLPLGPVQLKFYLLIALIGTIFPNSASYQAIAVLPVGIVSILLSLIPMMAFPVALWWGLDKFSVTRLGGLVFGMVGVLVLILPQASLPDPAMIWFIPLALIAPLFYAFEGNVIARWGTYGLDPIQTLLGASVVGAIVMVPVTLATGQWISPLPGYGVADLGIVASSLAHVAAYVCYFWLIGRAGSVFAIQVSYLATGFGVLWAMVILSETYSNTFWLAMLIMFVGLFLVQPRSSSDQEDAYQ
ncbi:DMT family transporter [Algirhabdus cladophorae]|uniref:DMT family transporter n=1 Tax=Algirhabdus cladophorae TaxID=3377108 RepID=UPI003B848543